jgi:lycopene cyclase domain-containing protein
MNYLYLLLDILVLAGPLALSFDKKVAFYKKWKYLFPAIAGMMVIFIPWDIAFTHYEIWGFNEKYICGIYVYNIPIEEVLFFPVTHYACVFIYECLNAYIKKDVLATTYKYILLGLSAIGIFVLALYPMQLYSSMKMGGAAIFVIILLYIVKPTWLSRFTLTFLVSLLPFFLMNGILTGSFIEEEIVWYNPHHIFNIRMGTIPIEDIFYSLFMLLTTVLIYEWLKSKTKNDSVSRGNK